MRRLAALFYANFMVPLAGFEPAHVPLRRRAIFQLIYSGVMVPLTGISPAACRVETDCSITELQRRLLVLPPSAALGSLD